MYYKHRKKQTDTNALMDSSSLSSSSSSMASAHQRPIKPPFLVDSSQTTASTTKTNSTYSKVSPTRKELISYSSSNRSSGNDMMIYQRVGSKQQTRQRGITSSIAVDVDDQTKGTSYLDDLFVRPQDKRMPSSSSIDGSVLPANDSEMNKRLMSSDSKSQQHHHIKRRYQEGSSVVEILEDEKISDTYPPVNKSTTTNSKTNEDATHQAHHYGQRSPKVINKNTNPKSIDHLPTRPMTSTISNRTGQQPLANETDDQVRL